MRQMAQPLQQRPPVANAVILHPHQIDIGARAQQPVLQIAPHAIGDGQRDDQRRHPRRNPGH